MFVLGFFWGTRLGRVSSWGADLPDDLSACPNVSGGRPGPAPPAAAPVKTQETGGIKLID
jgi:hypothetical protein